MSSGVFARAFGGVKRFVCGLHGHDALLHFEQGRMSLQCMSCGHETPGWDLKGSPRHHAGPRGESVVRMPLVRERRAA